MIQVEALYHSYTDDENYAIRDISFQIDNGEAFGLLGPSGAGKSTTQGILTGLLQLKKGRVQVADHDMARPDRSLFNQIGVSFEQSNVYGKLTALENLVFYSKLFDVPTLDPMSLLKLVGLDHVANKKTSTFSKGMKHRLTFARSMINSPVIWFLDEPTTGLDPAIAGTIKDIVKEKKAQGTTILLTTHNMFLADELCDRVGFIVDGELKLIDSPKNLKLQYGEKLVQVDYLEDENPVKAYFSLVDEREVAELNEILRTKPIEMMHTKEATLEEIFIKVTGRKLV
jgi:fluoroquinolone transport system ATP-binding protein